jgi:hypothetical protein
MTNDVRQGKVDSHSWAQGAKIALLLIGEAVFFSACTAFDVAMGMNLYLAVAISVVIFSYGLVKTFDVIKGRES